jgi:nicotinate-nucleotide adenylyltransferase
MILAAEACEQLGLERLLWVLTPNPPHKLDQIISPLAQRLELLEAALGDHPAYQISRVEIDRPGPHYADETVRLLAAQFPGATLFYLMGGDSLSQLPAWHNARSLVTACDGLGVMRRPEAVIDLTALETLLPGLTAKVHFVDAPLLEISSTQIRERIAAGRHYRYYLLPAVYDLILQRGYYR